MGYLAQLSEWEDNGFAIFSEPVKAKKYINGIVNINDNCYTYDDIPLYDLMKILEDYTHIHKKKIKITIQTIK